MSFPSAGSFTVAYQGMMAAQSALSVINHNIANASTPGYNRQRLDLTTNMPLGVPSGGRLIQWGQGVQIQGISQYQDNFLDAQIQGETSRRMYDKTKLDTLSQIEGILGEPQGTAISASINAFFDAAHGLSSSPESAPARIQFVQASKNMMQTFQDIGNLLQNVRTNITGSPDTTGSVESSLISLSTDQVNVELQAIADLNSQISIIQNSGAAPNDLLSKRASLLESLAEKINITSTYHADTGMVDVSLGSNVLVKGGLIRDTLDTVANTGATKYDNPALIKLATAGTDVTSLITGGSISGYLVMGGPGTNITTPRSILKDLDKLFAQLANDVNAIQANGLQLDGSATTAGTDDTLFDLTAGTDINLFGWEINSAIDNDPNLLAAADSAAPFAGTGDGRNALKIAQLEDDNVAALGNKSYSEYFQGMVSHLGIDYDTADLAVQNHDSIKNQLEEKRQSLVGVNVEEEMVNLLKFQRSYEASARVLKALSEMMQTILNTF